MTSFLQKEASFFSLVFVFLFFSLARVLRPQSLSQNMPVQNYFLSCGDIFLPRVGTNEFDVFVSYKSI